MKSALILCLSATAFAGCFAEREVQAEFVRAELVRVDTVFRHPQHQKLLVWRTPDHQQYITFTSLNDQSQVGLKMMVMVKR